MRNRLKIFIVLVVMATNGAPDLWAFQQATTVVIPDDGDLTIIWRARATTDGVQLRLYSVDSLGSTVLLAEQVARAGVETYRYLDDRARGGLPVQFRLCVVKPDGEETTLGVVNCFEPDMDDSGTTLGSVKNFDMAAIVVVDGAPPPSGSGKVVGSDRATWGFRPHPPVPPPRSFVGSKPPKRPLRALAG